MDIRTDRAHSVAGSVETVWAAIVDVDRYPARWPWLRELEWNGDFVAGAGCSSRVRSPFGYSVRVEVVLDHVEPRRLVEATVTGDVAGRARLSLAPVGAAGDGCHRTELRLLTELQPERRLLRVLTRALPPVARAGHDRIIRSGMARFAADVHHP